MMDLEFPNMAFMQIKGLLTPEYTSTTRKIPFKAIWMTEKTIEGLNNILKKEKAKEKEEEDISHSNHHIWKGWLMDV